MLTRLKIRHVRNLRKLEFPQLHRINIFSGANGSGKTSILEAVHLLSMARSFRGTGIKPLLTHGEESCTVFGQLSTRAIANGGGLALGVKRGSNGAVEIKIAGKAVRTVAELAENLPLQVINANSFDLLTGAPGSRRRYLDWGVFHVEHRFFSEWQKFQRCIKQRNKLLRHGKISRAELQVWTRELVETGIFIGECRQRYFNQLKERFQSLLSELLPSVEGLDVRYRQGWDSQLSFDRALENTEKSDIEQGYTHIGPQRADIRLLLNGHMASETLSRGQQKLVVCALILAQGQLLLELSGQSCVYLVDDLPSELDKQHTRLICDQLAAMGSQVFITCIEGQDLSSMWPEGADIGMFHVEHGTLL